MYTHHTQNFLKQIKILKLGMATSIGAHILLQRTKFAPNQIFACTSSKILQEPFVVVDAYP